MEPVTFGPQMTLFFSLSPSSQRERIAKLKTAFHYIAGENLSDFIEHLLKKTAFGRTNFLQIHQKDRNFELIDNLKSLMKSSPAKHLPALCSLVTPIYSLKELEDLGFHMTKNEYTYSKKIKK